MSLQKDHAGFYTSEIVGKTRSITPEGFLLCEGVPIARTGEQVYGKHELSNLEDTGGLIVVSRPEEEVFRPETLASFEGKPVTVNHPEEGVNPENWKNVAVGHVQNVRRGTGIEDDLIVGDLLITEADAIAYVNKHLPDVSSGYNADYDQTEAGKAVQRNIVGNHVAMLAGGRGRAGARVSFRDEDLSTEGVFSMSNRKFMRALRAGLATIGVKTADADKLTESLEETMDGDPDEKTDKKILDMLGSMDERMKGLEADKASRDARDEELKKEAQAKENADKASKDAADAAAAKEEEESGQKEEATGDTVLEAETVGHIINLGKTWTGDAANPSVLDAVIARGEILAPGIAKPTADSIKGNKGVVLAAFMRSAIEKHMTSDAAGATNVHAFLLNRKVQDLRGTGLVGVFNGVAQLARVRNNQSTLRLAVSGTRTGDFSKPMTADAINSRNREFWDKRNKA